MGPGGQTHVISFAGQVPLPGEPWCSLRGWKSKGKGPDLVGALLLHCPMAKGTRIQCGQQEFKFAASVI